MKKIILLIVALLTLAAVTPANASGLAKHHHGKKAASHAAGKHHKGHAAKDHHHKNA